MYIDVYACICVSNIYASVYVCIGQYVIHVGELLTTGGTLSFPQAPWGRTSSSDFQVTLSEQFHCILSASLPRFPFSRDHITVWKRTKWIHGMTYLIIIILCTPYLSYYIFFLHLYSLILPYTPLHNR